MKPLSTAARKALRAFFAAYIRYLNQKETDRDQAGNKPKARLKELAETDVEMGYLAPGMTLLHSDVGLTILFAVRIGLTTARESAEDIVASIEGNVKDAMLHAKKMAADTKLEAAPQLPERHRAPLCAHRKHAASRS